MNGIKYLDSKRRLFSKVSPMLLLIVGTCRPTEIGVC